MTKTRIFKGKTVDGVYHFNYNKILFMKFTDGTGFRITLAAATGEFESRLLYSWYDTPEKFEIKFRHAVIIRRLEQGRPSGGYPSGKESNTAKFCDGKIIRGFITAEVDKVFIVAFADGTGLRIMIDNEEPPKLTYGWFGKERFQKMVDYHTNQGIHSEDHLSFYKVYGRRQRVR
jgi:hypothetical protein